MTELIKSERCADPWLQEVQEEIRHGKLSANNHNFLHGKPTSVPGSWCDGDVSCKQSRCRDMVGPMWDKPLAAFGKSLQRKSTQRTSEYIMKHQCAVCHKERVSKQRVANGAADERFQSQKFSNAPAIFANNDVKHETNKIRARRFATDRKDVITYAVAKDTPSAQALRERPGLSGEKLSWLNRHDRESGDLYGMLPLIPSMSMALTDHIDRSPDKQLLRSTLGYLHSLVLAPGEQSIVENGVRIPLKLPPVVFLKLPNAT